MDYILAALFTLAGVTTTALIVGIFDYGYRKSQKRNKK
jgi:hypothetical protein